jgi:hypothetical protein
VAGPLPLLVGVRMRFVVTSEDAILELRAPDLGLSVTAVPGRLEEREALAKTAGVYSARVTHSGKDLAAPTFEALAPEAFEAALAAFKRRVDCK